jgi:predicted transcriptional regulator
MNQRVPRSTGRVLAGRAGFRVYSPAIQRRFLLLAVPGDPAYNQCVEIFLAPELEAKLNGIASQTGKGTGQIVEELVVNYFDHDEWFRQAVAKGLASLDQGKYIS